MPAIIIAKSNLNGFQILKVDTSPITAGGLAAPIGAFASAIDGTGLFYKKGATDTEWEVASESNLQVLHVQQVGGQFTSINAALATITGSGINNRYVIIASGIFTETLIDLSTKPYVSLIGDSINTTLIQPAAANQHIIKVGEMNEVAFLSLNGAGAGYAGVYSSNGGVFSQLHKLSIYDCDICVLIENTTVDTEFYLEYVDFAGVFSYGIKIVNNGAGTLFVNAENQYSFNSDVLGGLISTYHIEGANATFELIASGNENDVNAGNGLTLHTGAIVNVMSSYFTNYAKGFYMPNTGAAPILNVLATFLNLNLVSIDIAHISGSGSFQGTTKTSPTFNIVSTATFGIKYLERLLGNKRELYFDSSLSNLVTGTTPTTTAAGRAFLPDTGFTFTSLSGVTGNTTGFNINFQVPTDFQSNGKMRVIWTSQTGTPANIKLQFILTKKALGEDMGTTTELGLELTFASTTQYNVNQSADIPITSTFVKGDVVSLRIYRLASDAADTFNGVCYIQGIIFEYESNK